MPQGLGRGYLFSRGPLMPIPPVNPKVIAFIDGQNLFHSAKDAFGYKFPNYDVVNWLLPSVWPKGGT